MSPEIITVIFIGAILLGVMTGYPISLVLGGLAMILGYFTIWDLNRRLCGGFKNCP